MKRTVGIAMSLLLTCGIVAYGQEKMEQKGERMEKRGKK
jgi:hypothetical protein